MHLRSKGSDCEQIVPAMIPRGSNSLRRKRLRAGSGGSPPPWSEQQQACVKLLGQKRDRGSAAGKRTSKRPRLPDSFQSYDPMWNKGKDSGSSSCVDVEEEEEEQKSESSSASENSAQQCCYSRLKSVDPKQPDHKAQDASDSSGVTEEAIAHEQEDWSNLDLLADCAERALEELPRRVFVPCLGFTVCRRRRPVRRAAPRREFRSLLLRFVGEKPAGMIISQGADGAVRSRSKRTRPVLLPSKLQDSVLLLKNKRSRRK